jgi:hypothetical protein
MVTRDLGIWTVVVVATTCRNTIQEKLFDKTGRKINGSDIEEHIADGRRWIIAAAIGAALEEHGHLRVADR